jgi:hypothetical protein
VFARGDNGGKLNKMKTVTLQRVKEMNSKMKEKAHKKGRYEIGLQRAVGSESSEEREEGAQK